MGEDEFKRYLQAHEDVVRLVLVEDMGKFYLFSYFEDDRQEKATKKGVYKYLKGRGNYDMVLLREDTPQAAEQFSELFGDSYYVAEAKKLCRLIPSAQPSLQLLMLKDLVDMIRELDRDGNRIADLLDEATQELETLTMKSDESPFSPKSHEPPA